MAIIITISRVNIFTRVAECNSVCVNVYGICAGVHEHIRTNRDVETHIIRV